MNVEHLVHMANRIGEFFAAMPDRDEALHGISDHIRKFWAPRMREQLTVDSPGLAPIVVEALKRHPILQRPVPIVTSDPREAHDRHEWDGASES